MIEFNPISVIKFITDVLSATDALDELGYYFIINDTFYPIEEISVFTGGVSIRNTHHDVYLDVTIEENDLIWHKKEN